MNARERYRHAYDNRHRCGVLGSQDLELLCSEVDRLTEENRQFREQFKEADEIIAEWEGHSLEDPPPGWQRLDLDQGRP